MLWCQVLDSCRAGTFDDVRELCAHLASNEVDHRVATRTHPLLALARCGISPLSQHAIAVLVSALRLAAPDRGDFWPSTDTPRGLSDYSAASGLNRFSPIVGAGLRPRPRSRWAR